MTDEPSLKELGERLERLDAPIRMWREQRDRAFAAAFGPQKGKLSNLMGRLPQAANAAAALGLGPRDEVFAVFDEICDNYARSDAPRCAMMPRDRARARRHTSFSTTTRLRVGCSEARRSAGVARARSRGGLDRRSAT